MVKFKATLALPINLSPAPKPYPPTALMKVVDYNLMAAATAAFGHVMPDFRRHAKPRHAKAT